MCSLPLDVVKIEGKSSISLAIVFCPSVLYSVMIVFLLLVELHHTRKSCVALQIYATILLLYVNVEISQLLL